MEQKTKTLEELMNSGFHKAFVEDRHALIREFEFKGTDMVEIYEIQDGQWQRAYYGHKSYVERYISYREKRKGENMIFFDDEK